MGTVCCLAMREARCSWLRRSSLAGANSITFVVEPTEAHSWLSKIGQLPGCLDTAITVSGKVMRANSGVLAMASEFFETALFGDCHLGMPPKRELTVHDVDPAIFQTFLDYCHCRPLSLDLMMAVQLGHLAELYGVERLTERCYAHLNDYVTPSNCCSMLVAASQNNTDSCWKMRQRCLRMVLEKFPTVGASPDFRMLPVDVLVEILQSDDLRVPLEECVIEAVEYWLGANGDSEVEQLIPHIRWPLVSSSKLQLLQLEGPFARSASFQRYLVEALNMKAFGGNLQQRLTSERMCNRKLGAQLGSCEMIVSGDGQLNKPCGIATDDERIYVTDPGRHCVQVFDKTSGEFVGLFGNEGDDPGQFREPYGVAVDSERVYVSDTKQRRIQVFNKDGEWQDTWGEGRLSEPWGLAVDEQRLYVCDSSKSCVQVFRLRDGSHLLEWGSHGAGDGQLNLPVAVAVLDAYVYVADTINSRIQVFSKDGTFMRMWGCAGDGEGQFGMPLGLATGDDYIYVTDRMHDCVQVFRPDGMFVRRWGSHGDADSHFKQAWGVAVDTQFVYVADAENGRVQVFS